MAISRAIHGTFLLRRPQLSSFLYKAPQQYEVFRTSAAGRRSNSTQFLPTILQPSFWRSLMPKSLRSRHSSEQEITRPKAKEWNPATYFIWIFLLIGSQAIQMIGLERDFVQFTNHTEAKLSLLREVVRKVQNGEDVDVEAVLGTGDQAKEKEWEEVMRELEEEDALIQSRRQKRKAKEAAKIQETAQASAEV